MHAGRHALKRWMMGGRYGTMRYTVLHAFLVSRLAPTHPARLKLFVLVASLPILDHLPWQRLYRVRLHYKGLDVAWRLLDQVDGERLQEILLSGCYDDLPVANPRSVLDLGSHAGVSLLHFRATYPQARIVGVEPNPDTFPRLSTNAETLGVEVHKLAVAGQNGPTALFLGRQSDLASLGETAGGEVVTVEGRTLDALLEELGFDELDVLKIDVEGGEFDAFRASRRLRDINVIIGEFHADGDPGGRDALFAMLGDFDVEVRQDDGKYGIFVAVRRKNVRRGGPASA